MVLKEERRRLGALNVEVLRLGMVDHNCGGGLFGDELEFLSKNLSGFLPDSSTNDFKDTACFEGFHGLKHLGHERFQCIQIVVFGNQQNNRYFEFHDILLIA